MRFSKTTTKFYSFIKSVLIINVILFTSLGLSLITPFASPLVVKAEESTYCYVDSVNVGEYYIINGKKFICAQSLGGTCYAMQACENWAKSTTSWPGSRIPETSSIVSDWYTDEMKAIEDQNHKYGLYLATKEQCGVSTEAPGRGIYHKGLCLAAKQTGGVWLSSYVTKGSGHCIVWNNGLVDTCDNRDYRSGIGVAPCFNIDISKCPPKTIAYANGHNFASKNISDDYLKSAATCTTPAIYYYKCSRCDEIGTETYEYGSPNGHVWSYKNSSVTVNPTPYKTGIRTFVCEHDKTHTSEQIEPQYQFNICIGTDRIKEIAKGTTILFKNTTLDATELPFVKSSGMAAIPK